MQFSVLNSWNISPAFGKYVLDFLPRHGVQVGRKPEDLELPTRSTRSPMGVIYFPGMFANPEKRNTRVRFGETSVVTYPITSEEKQAKRDCYRQICASKSENYRLSELAMSKNLRFDEGQNQVKEYYLSPEERKMKLNAPAMAAPQRKERRLSLAPTPAPRKRVVEKKQEKKAAVTSTSQRRERRLALAPAPVPKRNQKVQEPKAKNPVRQVVSKVASKVADCSRVNSTRRAATRSRQGF